MTALPQLQEPSAELTYEPINELGNERTQAEQQQDARFELREAADQLMVHVDDLKNKDDRIAEMIHKARQALNESIDEAERYLNDRREATLILAHRVGQLQQMADLADTPSPYKPYEKAHHERARLTAQN